VCTTCLGGIAGESHTGGGAVSHQWGYRAFPFGPITDIPFAASPTYVLNGADFPGPGNYLLVVRVTAACGGPAISDDVFVSVANTPGPTDEVPFFTVTSSNSRNVLEWVYLAGFNAVRIRYSEDRPASIPPTPSPRAPSSSTRPEPRAIPTSPTRPGHERHDLLLHRVRGQGRQLVDGPHQLGQAVRDRRAAQVGVPLRDVLDHGPERGRGRGHRHQQRQRRARDVARPGGRRVADGLEAVAAGGAVEPLADRSDHRQRLEPVVFLARRTATSTGRRHGRRRGGSPGPRAFAGGRASGARGLFTDFGGDFDYLLVGTREALADNVFEAIDPANGTVLATFNNGGPGNGIGIISSMAAVAYLPGADRVYFTSYRRPGGSANTLWCLELGPTPGVFTPCWARDDLGDIESAPVLRGDASTSAARTAAARSTRSMPPTPFPRTTAPSSTGTGR
jgi:hypothetical protein